MAAQAPEKNQVFPPLKTFHALSFDVFGTLVDWEAGIYPYLVPLLAHLPADHPFQTPFPSTPTQGERLASQHPLIKAFNEQEGKIMNDTPGKMYTNILMESYIKLAQSLSIPATKTTFAEAEAVASSIATWRAFPDTITALRTLRTKHDYKLIALSNITNAAIEEVLTHALKGAKFDAVYTAENIGSYKPDARNFSYLKRGVAGFGIEREGLEWERREREGSDEDGEEGRGVKKGLDWLCHVAHGVGSDQVPAEEAGLWHVWVERGVDNWVGREGVREGMGRLGVVSDMERFVEVVENGW